MMGAGVLCTFLFLIFSAAQSQRLCSATSCYCDALGQAEYDYHLACPSLSNKTLDIEVTKDQSQIFITDIQNVTFPGELGSKGSDHLRPAIP